MTIDEQKRDLKNSINIILKSKSIIKLEEIVGGGFVDQLIAVYYYQIDALNKKIVSDNVTIKSIYEYNNNLFAEFSGTRDVDLGQDTYGISATMSGRFSGIINIQNSYYSRLRIILSGQAGKDFINMDLDFELLEPNSPPPRRVTRPHICIKIRPIIIIKKPYFAK